jgi:hypothetical protein
MWYLVGMTEVQIAWLAGLLEGEGYFGVYRGSRPVVEVKMVDRDVVQRVGELLGNPVPVAIPAANERCQVQYRARVRGKGAEVVMRDLLPHMGKRRASRIREILAGL